MRILQISMGEEFGGIEQLELNILKNIDNSFKIDFLTPNELAFKDYECEINDLGGNFYNFGVSRKKIVGKIKYAFRLLKFLKNNSYDVVHINSSAFLFSFHVALISKIRRVKKVIVHSHSNPKVKAIKKILIWLLSPIYTRCANEFLSCSNKAKYSLYSKRFIKKEKIKIIKNAINTKLFKYDEDKRNIIRSEMNLENKYVYGHVGRFDKVKNHSFLINIFNEIQKMKEDSILLLVGEGILEEEIKRKTAELGIMDKVIFLGFRKDINDLLNVMDAFIFPSISEGFGISALEAQINGLPVYCSNTIPDEVKISNRFKRFDLNDNPKHIANMILDDDIDCNSRIDAYKDAIEKGYDIKYMCERLEEIYRQVLL